MMNSTISRVSRGEPFGPRHFAGRMPESVIVGYTLSKKVV